MRIKFLQLILLFAIIATGKAQVGGTGVFQILEVPLHARSMAWGGYLLASPTSDVQFASNNPALLNKSLHNNYGVTYGSFLPGVSNGGVGYAYNKGIHNFSFHAQYLDYGTMKSFDDGGNPMGTVSANETKVTLGYSREISERITVGAQLGFVYSVLEPYVSNGIFSNLGAHYNSKDTLIQMGLVAKNMGFMLNVYRDADREALPFNIQYGVSIKPAHMPVRFQLIAHSLQKWDLTYNQYLKTGTMDLNGQEVLPQESNFGDKLSRHLALGMEFILGEHLGLLVGYNHQRRAEMAPEAQKGVAGFGWGLKFKVYKFHITYASSSYFTGFNSNMFSISLIPAFLN
jgi:hypothetical protein